MDGQPSVTWIERVEGEADRCSQPAGDRVGQEPEARSNDQDEPVFDPVTQTFHSHERI